MTPLAGIRVVELARILAEERTASCKKHAAFT
jgi:hypothetical protein